MSPTSEERGPVELLADDFLARCKGGEKPTIKEYCDRHPELADEIRDVFEALLMVEDLKPGSHDVSGSFGESVKVDGKRLEQVGDYRILCEIGRGGMGVVYEAEQQALGRRVALKVMPRTSGGDGSALIRFQREAKAAARLHHTNIVPVFDVGQDGEYLYYAMQLIHGQGLDRVIEDVKRLRAKSTAVPAAGRGPQDRSIAASLVTGQFEKENLAAVDSDDSGATEAYEGSSPSSAMLPGQLDITSARSNRRAYFRSVAHIGLQTASALSYAHSRGIIHRDIKPGNLILDTTGNVWATDFGLAKTGEEGMTHTGDILGTLRYMSPERFRGQCDVRADVYALGMTLYELVTLKAAYASADRLKLIELIRQMEAASPRTIDARIPWDLETIVMKAIDKDPKRRYQSADEMGEDLQRFVDDEPIKARRIGSVERLSRWCRRNPVVASLTAAVLVLLVVGTTLSTWQAVVATQARADLAARNAELAAEQAKVEARNKELAAEQAKVEARFELAQKAIALFHTGVSENLLLKNPQFKELRTKLLKEAAGFYADLEKLLAGQTDAKSRKALAAAYFQLGVLTDEIGDKQEALAVHRKALKLRRELAAAEGADVETRLDVARSLWSMGILLGYVGDWTGALKACEEQRDIATALEPEHPTDAVHTALAKSYGSLGFVLTRTGRQAEALEVYRKALLYRKKVADANPTVAWPQGGLAFNHHTMGWALMQTGEPKKALTELETAVNIAQKLVDANPSVPRFLRVLALSYQGIGRIRERTGKPAEALEAYQKALAAWQKAAAAYPGVTDFQNSLAWNYNVTGRILREAGRPAEALQAHHKALDIEQKLAHDNPSVTEFERALAATYGEIGTVLARTGKSEEALTALHKAVAGYQKRANPTNPQSQEDLAWSHNQLGRLLARQKRFDEAFTAIDAGLAIRQKVADEYPKNMEYASNLGESYAFRGWALVRSGQTTKAAADLRQAVKLLDKAPAPEPKTRFERARTLALLAGLGREVKSGVTKAEGAAFADQAVSSLLKDFRAGWRWPNELKEPDFDALRGRDDFKQLVAEVEAKSGPKARRKD